VLDQDVPMDLVAPLARAQVNGRFEESAEAVLLARPALIGAAARDLIYDLHGHQLAPRPGTALPAPAHVTWHIRQVFKGEPLAA
jgi:hypothetical protein